jgi:hypothetical protein
MKLVAVVVLCAWATEFAITTWNGGLAGGFHHLLDPLFLALLIAALFLYQYARELRGKLHPSEETPRGRPS